MVIKLSGVSFFIFATSSFNISSPLLILLFLLLPSIAVFSFFSYTYVVGSVKEVYNLRLNPDCIRDILMNIEDVTDFYTVWNYQEGDASCPLLSSYSHNEIVYHVSQCERAGLISSLKIYDNGGQLIVSDLSPAGHQFIANIRSDTVWNNVKNIGLKIGATSLTAITQIATGVISELIKSQLGFI